MANPFATLSELLEQLLSDHIENGLLGDVLASQKQIEADLLSIKVFLGVPDARIGATEAQLEQLGTRIQGLTTAVQKFDTAATEPPKG